MTDRPLGVGVIAPFRHLPSLTATIAAVSRRYVGAALAALLLFYLVASYAILTSNLSMMTVWW